MPSNFKEPKIREPKYLRGYQNENCEAKYLGGCSGDVVAAHLDGAGGKGTGTKTDDCFSTPLCYVHHAEEGRGWARFWHRVFAEDTFFLVQCLKAYRFIKFLKWLLSEGRESEAIELLKRFK